jgi:hypothetical protein
MKVAAAVASWSGRVPALGLVAFWGAFFLAHLGRFLHPAQGLPPARIWLLQAIHLLLAGLLMLVRWEIPGSVLTITAALVFFASVAGHRFPLFFGVTVVPVLLVLLGRWLRPAAVA